MAAKEVFVVGDSISIQYGLYLEAYLADRFTYARRTGEEEALRNLDIPKGANSGDSAMVRAYLAACAKDENWRPDVLLVNCGLHDIKTDPKTGEKQVPLADYEANLRSVIEIMRGRRSTRLVWMRTTPAEEAVHNRIQAEFHRFAADVEQYNRAADAIMEEAKVPVIDLYGFTRKLGTPEEIYCDHVHFVEDVRRQQAAYIAGWLEGYLSGALAGTAPSP